jgi:predicted O-methyltransferase YrrM
MNHFLTAKRNGHGVHSPFVYDLVENVFSNKFQFYVFEELNNLRKCLATNETELLINDLGAGSKKLNSNKRRVKEIARHGISSKKQSEIYFKLINYLKCGNIIELGTSLGLNTVYFCKANPKANVYTIEGSESLYRFSKNLLSEQNCSKSISVNANFDDALPELLSKMNSLDLMYIDGNHSYEPTIRYFNMALKKKNKDSIIILDDIYWSREMIQAWETIKAHEEVKLTIDCFYFGIVFFKDEMKQKEHFKLFI